MSLELISDIGVYGLFETFVTYSGGETVQRLLQNGKAFDCVESEVNGVVFPQNMNLDSADTDRIHIGLFRQTKPHWHDEVTKELNRQRFASVGVAELLCFGNQYPKLQCEYPLILGTGECSKPLLRGPWPVRFSVYLGGNTEGKRGVGIIPADGPFEQHVLIAGKRL